jgi:hypothetical protein
MAQCVLNVYFIDFMVVKKNKILIDVSVTNFFIILRD